MNLHPDHIADLHHSGLTDETVALMGARSVVPQDVSGFENGLYACVDSILELPYPGIDGFSRYKLFPALQTQTGTMRYFQPAGTGNHLYILPPVADILSDFRVTLVFVEGEKKTARAVQEKLNAIGFSGIWNWKEKDAWSGIEELKTIPFADRTVDIVPDSDTWLRDDLQRPVYAFARYLESRGARVLVVLLPQSGTDKVGLDDYFLTRSLDKFQLEKRITTKHATLSQHKEWYDGWKSKASQKDSASSGNILFLENDEPHSEAVDGAELLNLVAAFIRRYLAIELEAAHAAALWVLHAWTLDAFHVSPFLFLTSATKRCGKTTLLDLIRMLSPRGVAVSNITGPALFRVIEQFNPTLIIDEAETFVGDKDDLRGILNAGHRRNTACVARVVGEDHEVKLFPTWAPKAIAAIGKIADTLEDRSIVIHMKRRAPGEKIERFRVVECEALAKPIRQGAARWAQDNIESLRDTQPRIPESLNDRAQDNWTPLLAVAEVAGAEWTEHAESAALMLCGEVDEADGSALVELLGEFYQIFQNQDRISSADFIEHLTKDQDSRWIEWYHGQPITQRQVARLLNPLSIRPKQIRLGDKTLKGYLCEWFEDAFSRYLPKETPADPKQSKQSCKHNDLGEKNNAKQDEVVSNPKNNLSARSESGVSLVSDEKPTCGGNGYASNGNGKQHDANGFDWTNGVQSDDSDDIEEQWRRIKADHAARRAQ
jgi:putative DNA primase/helicase